MTTYPPASGKERNDDLLPIIDTIQRSVEALRAAILVWKLVAVPCGRHVRDAGPRPSLVISGGEVIYRHVSPPIEVSRAAESRQRQHTGRPAPANASLIACGFGLRRCASGPAEPPPSWRCREKRFRAPR